MHGAKIVVRKREETFWRVRHILHGGSAMPQPLSGLAPAKPIMLKERASMVFLQYGEIDVIDGAFVLVDKKRIRTQIPVGSVACIMLETGTRITHEAVKVAANVGCLLLWVADGGGRLYSAGQPGGARADRLLYQAKLALDDTARLKVVRAMYAMRFGEAAPAKRSIEQLRGIEGARVRAMYKNMARRFGITWGKRSYDPKNWSAADPLNRALSVATASLYGLCEAGVLAAGYSPAIGFIHSGKPRSFVYDIADLFKFETVVPTAFRLVAQHSGDVDRRVRLACRDEFRKQRLLKRIIPAIEKILNAGELEGPKPPPDSIGPAFAEPEGIGDAGHRN